MIKVRLKDKYKKIEVPIVRMHIALHIVACILTDTCILYDIELQINRESSENTGVSTNTHTRKLECFFGETGENWKVLVFVLVEKLELSQ